MKKCEDAMLILFPVLLKIRRNVYLERHIGLRKPENSVQVEKGTTSCCMLVEGVCQVCKYALSRCVNLMSQK